MTVERLALRRATTRVVCTGMGPARSTRAAAMLAGRPILVAGVAGGLAPHVQVGDLVVATEVRGPDGERIECPSAPLLAGALRRAGVTVHLGLLASQRRVSEASAARRRLAGTGAIAVDTESVWLAPTSGQPFAVVRAISDTEAAPLLHHGIVRRGIRALRQLGRAVPALDAWAAAVGTREIARVIGPGRDVTLTAGKGPAHAVVDLTDVDFGWLAGATRIEIAVGPRAPEQIVDDLVGALAGLSPVVAGEPEDLPVPLPKEVA
jgi:Phosphorylase superfamily